MHDLHKQVHPCPRADQYDQARPPADSWQPLMVGRGQWCTGPGLSADTTGETQTVTLSTRVKWVGLKYCEGDTQCLMYLFCW